MTSPPRLAVRWSEHEARKPYARPFGVTFTDEAGAGHGAIAVSGADLLYYRQLQGALLSLAGVVFRDPRVEPELDPQRAWLDVLSGLLPPARELRLVPVSELDPVAGRVFVFRLEVDGMVAGNLTTPELLGYQDLQAAIAHRAGRLLRLTEVEAIAEPIRRQAAWMERLSGLVVDPAPEDAMTPDWPWR